MLSEAAVTDLMRLAAVDLDEQLFRNSSGALYNSSGRLVRFGLGHESAATIRAYKTSDWIGWRRRLITPDMVGDSIAQFAAREAKPEGWTLTPGDARGQAQKRFLDLVNAHGGDGRFITCVGDLLR